ncbi:hypothetical protein FOA52_000351 [Chlamydomonas sp. UWO 241]|nr:hypothetical protein FOA52_000351 [Chlamydomonas sp. UWO 241]
MPEIGDGAFAGVLDKGTLDALNCGDTADRDCAEMCAEVSRVLSPGGIYMMVTSHPPQSRYRLIADTAYGWAVHVYEVGQQGACEGPHTISPLAGDDEKGLAALGLPRMPYSHFVYVCRKAK